MKNFEEITTYLRTSANYHFCNTFLPAWFFHSPRLFQALMASESALDKMLNGIFSAMEKNGFDVDEFSQNIKYRLMMKDGETKVLGIIFSIPNVKYEPECNFVCVAFTHDNYYYFESELFDDEIQNKQFFGLCGRKEGGMHFVGDMSHDIRTYEDMWEVVCNSVR